jgi:hypothetical protein
MMSRVIMAVPKSAICQKPLAKSQQLSDIRHRKSQKSKKHFTTPWNAFLCHFGTTLQPMPHGTNIDLYMFCIVKITFAA